MDTRSITEVHADDLCEYAVSSQESEGGLLQLDLLDLPATSRMLYRVMSMQTLRRFKFLARDDHANAPEGVGQKQRALLFTPRKILRQLSSDIHSLNGVEHHEQGIEPS